MNNFAVYFLLFMIYSFLGWFMEVIKTIFDDKKVVNRGFLIGPYCPIYGCGVLLMIIFLSRFKPYPVVLFLMSIIVCSVLEYITSFIMEKVFKARWWDYSNRKYNLNGRICINTLIPFGILGLVMLYLVNPFLLSVLAKIPMDTLNVLAYTILIFFSIDNIISFYVIFKFKGTIKHFEKDSTEEITKKVKEVLLSKGILHRRLIKAYPNVIATKERIESALLKIEETIREVV